MAKGSHAFLPSFFSAILQRAALLGLAAAALVVLLGAHFTSAPVQVRRIAPTETLQPQPRAGYPPPPSRVVAELPQQSPPALSPPTEPPYRDPPPPPPSGPSSAPPLPPLPPLPDHVAFLNPAAAWLTEPTARRNGVALLLFRRFDGTNVSTWYRGHASWRGGSIRNFVGDSCLVAALATTGSSGGVPKESRLQLRVDPTTIHFAHDCLAERALPFERRSRIEDPRLFRRADGQLQALYASPIGGGDIHSISSAPIELISAPAGGVGAGDDGHTMRTRVRLALERRVALCATLLTSLGLEHTPQKNWSPFVWDGADYIVYSPVPLRIFRVDYPSGACHEAPAATPPALLARVDACAGGTARAAGTPLRDLTRAWRRCTGALLPLPRAVGNADERRMRRGYTLALGGGTPGVHLRGASASGRGRSAWPQWLGRSGLARDDTIDDLILFAGHSRLHVNAPALLDALSGAPSGGGMGGGVGSGFADVGPDAGWHASYPKMYHAFWYAIRPPSTRGRAAGGSNASFALTSMSRLFTPPNTHLPRPKIVFPTGLLLADAQEERCATPLLCASTRQLVLTYGELDVFSHAWAISLAEVGRAMLHPAALGRTVISTAAKPSRADAADAPSVAEATAAEVPLIIRSRRRVASAATPNELSMSLYRAPMPLGGGPSPLRASSTVTTLGGGCRALGFEVLWNTALHPFPGAPRADGEDCDAVLSEEAATPQQCCELCAAAAQEAASRAGRRRAQRGACTAWTFFAPRCYWAPTCARTLLDRELMWGAVAGLAPSPDPRSSRLQRLRIMRF